MLDAPPADSSARVQPVGAAGGDDQNAKERVEMDRRSLLLTLGLGGLLALPLGCGPKDDKEKEPSEEEQDEGKSKVGSGPDDG